MVLSIGNRTFSSQYSTTFKKTELDRKNCETTNNIFLLDWNSMGFLLTKLPINFINMGIFIVLPNQISLPKAKMPFKNAFLNHHPLQKSSTICNDTTKIFKIMSRVLKIMTQLLLLPCSTTHRDLN